MRAPRGRPSIPLASRVPPCAAPLPLRSGRPPFGRGGPAFGLHRWPRRRSVVLRMRHWTLPSVLVVAFGCATSAPESSMGGASPGEADVASEADAGADDVAPEQLVVDGRYSDERFLDMMAAHHAMAIAMAQVELQHGARPETLQ